MPRSRAAPPPARNILIAKIVGAAGLLALSDLIFFSYRGGSVIAVFTLVWLATLVVTQRAVRRAQHAPIAIIAAAIFALIIADDPNLLATLLFLAAIGSAALLPGHCFDHAGRWSARLITLAAKGPFRAASDLIRVSRMTASGGTGARSLGLHVALPLAGGGLFLALFASANPVLGSLLSSIRLPGVFTVILHAILLAVTLALVWPSLRPRAIRYAPSEPATRTMISDPPVTAMATTLIVFNAVFAIENLLDILFLWSGAALPADVTLADYAHRGSYTLIVTALLAAAFVLVALRPGSPAARNPWVRMLLLAWIAQNILLVASSVVRLIDYIDVYSLTVLRISALAWMGLVAVGLVLVCWRLFAGRSAAWLINANTLAALVVLSTASVVDLGAVSAAWNVRQARDPARLDLCYLRSLGPSSLLALIALRDAPVGAVIQDRAVYLSDQLYDQLDADQAHWQGWTFRGARRLARVERMLAEDPRIARPAPYGRGCDGAILARPRPYVPEAYGAPATSAAPGPEPLTREQNR